MEHHPVHQKVVGSVPGQGTHRSCQFIAQSGPEAADRCFSLISVSLSLSVCLCLFLFSPLPLSLRSINISSGEDYKKYSPPFAVPSSTSFFSYFIIRIILNIYFEMGKQRRQLDAVLAPVFEEQSTITLPMVLALLGPRL